MATLVLNKKTVKANRVKHNSGIFNNIFFTTIMVILIVFSLLVLGLLLWALITSIKHPDDYVFDGNVLGLPNFANYGVSSLWINFQTVLSKFHIEENEMFYTFSGTLISHTCNASFGMMFLNSIIYSGLGTVLQVFVPAVVAFLIAKYHFRFSKVVYMIALITYIIPIVGNYPSMLATLKNLGILDTWYGYAFLKFNFTGMYFFIFYAFFQGLNDSYIEAAELDGASQTQILVKIVLPLASKVIASVLLVVFIQLWNDYQTPLLYLKTHPTIAYGVWYMTNKSVDGASIVTQRMASVMCMALPIVLLFIFFKEKLMSNVSMGGVKE